MENSLRMPDSKTIKSSADLIALYEAMDDDRRRSLADFADFLFAQAEPVPREIAEPVDIPRPEDETVVGAIKRLKESYPMVESMSVFSKASALMTEHMVKGRDRVEVIDEMEVLFAQAYDDLVKDNRC